jgi:hypothetical protein
MKILVDLVKVRQEWDPETNVQSNSVIFRFAGKEYELPATEAEIMEAVRAAAEQREPAHTSFAGGALTSAMNAELDDAGDDNVFGGDFDEEQPVDPPSLFRADDVLHEVAEAPLAERAPAAGEPPFVMMAGRVLDAQALSQLSDAQRARLQAETRHKIESGDPSTRRAYEKFRMRLRAQQRPARQASTDEDGNPIATPRRRQHVEVAVTSSQDTAVGDDDGFPQA